MEDVKTDLVSLMRVNIGNYAAKFSNEFALSQQEYIDGLKASAEYLSNLAQLEEKYPEKTQ